MYVVLQAVVPEGSPGEAMGKPAAQCSREPCTVEMQVLWDEHKGQQQQWSGGSGAQVTSRECCRVSSWRSVSQKIVSGSRVVDIELL